MYVLTIESRCIWCCSKSSLRTNEVNLIWKSRRNLRTPVQTDVYTRQHRIAQSIPQYTFQARSQDAAHAPKPTFANSMQTLCVVFSLLAWPCVGEPDRFRSLIKQERALGLSFCFHASQFVLEQIFTSCSNNRACIHLKCPALDRYA